MDAEHGISFNKPYVMATSNISVDHRSLILKSRYKQNGSGANGAMQTNEVLVPIAIIDDDVFCIAMVNRVYTSQTEQEIVTPYQGAMPQIQSFYWNEQERLAYFDLIPIKVFIDQWKVRD